MNELQSINSGLPATPKELVPFIAVGTAAVNAARKVLRSCNLTAEKFRSVVVKGQEQAALVLDAKTELGKLIADTPKGTTNHKNNNLEFASKANSKISTFTDLGLTQKQASNYQLIAKNPDAVRKAMEMAKENDDIPTESLVLQVIKQEKNEAEKDLPQKQDKPRTWNYVYQSRASFANENESVINAFEELNKMKNDGERVDCMRNSIEFMADCIKAYKRAVIEMGYELKELL